jgi:hypothetical protein
MYKILSYHNGIEFFSDAVVVDFLSSQRLNHQLFFKTLLPFLLKMALTMWYYIYDLGF